jgi:hypothetical protein
MEALPQILVCPLVLIFCLIISLIPLWSSAASAGCSAITTTFATLLCKERSFWRELIFSLVCSFLFDKLGDDHIARGGHCGVFIHQVLQEDLPFVIPCDSVN